MRLLEEATSLVLNRSKIVALLAQMVTAREHDTFRNVATHLRDSEEEVQQALEHYEKQCAEHECDNISKR